jgi:hypothetical protein
MIELVSFQGYKDMQVSQWDTANKQNKGENHKIILIDAKRAFDKIQHSS